MPYLSLPNFNHDSGPKRIQSGPDHEGYVVLYSGVQSTGPDEGIVVAGSPLSGTLLGKAWDYDSNWRYVPSTLPDQDETTDATPYNASGALDTYDGARIYTRDNVAGAQAASAIGPETGKVNPRGGQPERYMYYGGAAPDNQDYSPYNTPDANSAAEGKTGGGVTHKAYESSLLTNVLGSQGTSDRSQWRYHQPVYCKTYTETRRSETPGLMSTPLRYVYRGAASSYNYNYGSELLANRGGFEQQFEDYPPLAVPGSGFITYTSPFVVTDTVSGTPSCAGGIVSWYRYDPSTGNETLLLEDSLSYTTVSGDIGFQIQAEVACPDPFSSTGFGPAGVIGITEYVLPAFQIPSGAAFGDFSLTENTNVKVMGGTIRASTSLPLTCDFSQQVSSNVAEIPAVWRLQRLAWAGTTSLGGPPIFGYNSSTCGGGYTGWGFYALNGSGIWQPATTTVGGASVHKDWVGTVMLTSLSDTNVVTVDDARMAPDWSQTRIETWEYGTTDYRYTSSQYIANTKRVSCSTGLRVANGNLTMSGASVSTTPPFTNFPGVTVAGVRITTYPERTVNYICSPSASYTLEPLFLIEYKNASGVWNAVYSGYAPVGTAYVSGQGTTYSSTSRFEITSVTPSIGASFRPRPPTSTVIF